MATLNRVNTFVAGGTILAAQVNEDLDDLFAHVNDELIHADGTNAFTAQISGNGSDPTADNHLARKAYVDNAAGGIVAHTTIDTGGSVANFQGGAVGDNTPTGAKASLTTSVDQVINHYYNHKIVVPIFCTNKDAALAAVATRVGLELQADGTSPGVRAWTFHDTADDGQTLILDYTFKAASTSTVEYTVHGIHSYGANATVRWNATSVNPLSYTVRDLGLDI